MSGTTGSLAENRVAETSLLLITNPNIPPPPPPPPPAISPSLISRVPSVECEQQETVIKKSRPTGDK